MRTVNSYIKPPLKRCKTKAADSRHAKVSRGRTKKDKDLEDSDTSSNVPRLRRRDRAAARARLAKRKHLLDSDDYCLDSSSDINPKDNLEDEEATTAKDLNERQSLCKSRDGNRTLHSRRHVRGLVATSLYTSLQTHIFSTSKSCYLIILTMIISYVLLKARERSTARAKGASPLTLNLDKQLQ
ncbi:hypothetical protein HBI76_246010 [Parastagonospora nodorum]|nr:hypothetical protein HBI76_246010 [Parastagonospora nodorum]